MWISYSSQTKLFVSALDKETERLFVSRACYGPIGWLSITSDVNNMGISSKFLPSTLFIKN